MSTAFPLPPVPRVRWSRGLTTEEVETRSLARLSTIAPRVAWDDFMRELEWRQGEHMALIGPTGQGKTYLLLHLLPRRKFVVMFGTKQRDKALSSMIQRYGFKRLTAWPSNLIPINPRDMPRRALWPNVAGIPLASRVDLQKPIFKDALDRIFDEGGWTVALDEAWWITNMLRLDTEIKVYLLQGREMGLSLVCASQRPAHIPLEIYDQSTHLFFWRDNDETNLKRISGFSNHSGDFIRNVVSNLEQYQVLYLNTRTGRMLRTRAPLPPREEASK